MTVSYQNFRKKRDNSEKIGDKKKRFSSGRAPQQVEDFLKDYVEPVLEANKDLLGIEVEINV